MARRVTPPVTIAAIRAMRDSGATSAQVADTFHVHRTYVAYLCAPSNRRPCATCGIKTVRNGAKQCGGCYHKAFGQRTKGNTKGKLAPKVPALNLCAGDQGRPCADCGPQAHHWELEMGTCAGRCIHCGAEKVHKPEEMLGLHPGAW